MVQILYTDTDAIRAALGLSKQDIRDEQIVSAMVELMLEEDLDRWLPQHPQIKEEGEAPDATPSQRSLWRKLRLYAQHFCAYSLCPSLRYAAVQRVGDGTAQMQRFDINVEDVAADMLAKATQFKAALAEEAGVEFSSTAFGIMGVVAPDSDPVTGG